MYDLLKGWRDSVSGLGNSDSDTLGAPPNPVVSGFSPTYNGNLTITFGNGRLYSLQAVDGSNYGGSVGTFLAPDANIILQQGKFASTTETFSTAGLSSGQSLYVLVEVTYAQADVITADDPTSGLLTFLNPTTPSSPWVGIGNDGLTNPTTRQAQANVTLKYGTAATTGLQVPPTVDVNYAPLYLVLLTFGQTSITSANVFVSGPSVAAGVPSNYPYAPFLAGLLNSHHDGNPGQAPQIKLTSEVQGILPAVNLPTPIPLANLPATNTVGVLPTIRVYAGNPNGNLAGKVQDFMWDSTDNVMWTCTVSGTVSTTVWVSTTNATLQAQLFTGNGTFNPVVSGNYLVILQAGGGGGGGGGGAANAGTAGGGGEGGAAGELAMEILALSVTGYPVTIGAGGTAGTAGSSGGLPGGDGGNGGNTSFNSIYSAGGGAGGRGGPGSVTIGDSYLGNKSFGGGAGGGGGGPGGAGVGRDTIGNTGTNAGGANGGGGGGGSGGYDHSTVFAGGSGGTGSGGYCIVIQLEL
ncbi:MAG TPA: hypothetical protein VND01_00770 [Candidatus Acidoferrales bacterium]|nr:hypothetical protein [Candidatus Acidoferrales bacterium]